MRLGGLIATGVAYRRLEALGVEELIGRGVSLRLGPHQAVTTETKTS